MTTLQHRNEQSPAIHHLASTKARSHYEWADVAFLPVNPTVLPIAQAVECELTALGVSCTYLWTTHPSERQQLWGDADIAHWKHITLPVQWYSDSFTNTVQMLQGLRIVQRLDLRAKFGVFVTFIDVNWSPRLLALACAQQGVPSVLLQEGVAFQVQPAPRPRSLRLFCGSIIRQIRERAAPHIFREIEDGISSEYACVYSAFKAESLVRNGKQPERIIITGNPLFDRLSQRSIDPYPRNRTILYAHQMLCEDFATEIAWWKALVQASQQVGAQLIFKMHPRSGLSEEQLRNFLDNPDPLTVQIVPTGDVQDMIADAGVFVAACSASSYRALIDGVPIVQLEGLPTIYHLDLADYGAVLPVYTPDALADTFRAALDEPHTRLALQQGVDMAIKRHLYKLDGQATQRTAAAIAGVMR